MSQKAKRGAELKKINSYSEYCDYLFNTAGHLDAVLKPLVRMFWNDLTYIHAIDSRDIRWKNKEQHRSIQDLIKEKNRLKDELSTANILISKLKKTNKCEEQG